MTDSFPNEPAPFITFYSFKGGVGRSMALVNVAGILAGRGFRVLAIDLDLEAPGISYLMGKERAEGEESPPGFVDLVLQGVKQPKQSDLFRAQPAELVERYTQPYAIPEELQHSDEGSLRIMPAGRFDANYGQRLNDLALGKLYAEGYGWRVIQAFKKKVQESRAFDYVFVDSRTGFSEESGICTRDLADYLVIVTGLNHQNTEGTARFLQALKASEPQLKDFRVVLSPMPIGEDELADQRQAEIQRRLSDAWGEEVSVSLQIPYHPRLAITEEPYVFSRSRGPLYQAYRSVEREVLVMLGHTANELSTKISEVISRGEPERAVETMRRLIKLDHGRQRLFDIFMTLNDEDISEKMEPVLSFIGENLADIPAPLYEFAAHRLAQLKRPEAALFYERAIEQQPDDIKLLNDYAVFLKNVWGDHEAAEQYYRRALEVDPRHGGVLTNYASFLTDVRSDHEAAEEHYQRALEVAPQHVDVLTNYASFLTDVRSGHDQAEEHYRRALEVDPKNVNALNHYASFLTDVRGDHDAAEEHYRRVLEVDPKNAGALNNYANFLTDVRRDHDRAEKYYRRALEADPQYVDVLHNYAVFLWRVRGDYDAAEEHYRRALEVDPKHAGVLGNYASFLTDVRGDHKAAKEYYRRALEVEPDDANTLGNYAKLLFIQGRPDEGAEMLRKAFAREPEEAALNCALYFYAYAYAWTEWPDALAKLKVLLLKGERSKGWKLGENARAAREQGHPEPEFVEALAKVVSDEESIETLEQFPVWWDVLT